MFNSSPNVDNFDSIVEDFVVTLPSNEDTFAILSFNDLDFCSSPCLDDSLMFSSSKLSLNMLTMDHQNMSGVPGKAVKQPPPDGEYYPSGSALADLSPGVEFADIDTFLREPQNPADFLNNDEVGLFLSRGLKGEQDVDSLGPLTTIETGAIDSAWLTNAIVIAPNQLKFTGTVFEDNSFAGIQSGKAEKILQEISIPSSVQDSYVCNVEEEEELDTNLSVTNISTEPTTSSSKSRKRRRQSVDPESDEYKKKRELNNISVRKSREKARQKQLETEDRVDILSTENNRLQERVDSLEKELTILKGLFSNIGASLPGEVTKFLSID